MKYPIEQKTNPFKMDDYVVFKKTGRVGQVIRITETTCMVKRVDDNIISYDYQFLKKATAEDILRDKSD